MVSGQSFGSSAVSLACITSMCSVQHFPVGHSLCLAFGSFLYPHPPSFIFSLINQCDKCLVPLAWGLMAGGHWFASQRGITLSRGWLCQKWKPLDIPAPTSTKRRVVKFSLNGHSVNTDIFYGPSDTPLIRTPSMAPSVSILTRFDCISNIENTVEAMTFLIPS